MLRYVLIVLVSSLTLVACSSPCTDMKSATDNFNKKSCAGTAKQGFNQSTCDQKVAQCTDADDRVIKTFSTCVSGLETCNSDNESNWNTAAAACIVGLAGVSASCGEAFN